MMFSRLEMALGAAADRAVRAERMRVEKSILVDCFGIEKRRVCSIDLGKVMSRDVVQLPSSPSLYTLSALLHPHINLPF